jgi:rubrerythrin
LSLSGFYIHSTKEDAMEIVNALCKMEEIEKMASELYRGYHAAFFHEQEAAYLFYRLYIEEKGHCNLVHYVRKLVRHNPKLFDAIEVTEEEFERICARLNKELSRKGHLTLDEALDVAEEFETTLSEGYLKRLPLKNNLILLNLYKALCEAEHSEKITEFKMKRTSK